METNLTKKMKRGLSGFKLEMPTNMRTARFAEEVWTPTGIVDFIRFEDYKEKDYSFCSLIDFDKLCESEKKSTSCFANGKVYKCKIEGETFPNKNCKGCIFCRRSALIGMLVTCYECKITLSDFKSENGHNFHGNKNYYVVPNELYPKIKDLVPNDIGIIAYYPEKSNYRIKKECEFKEISHELKERLLYDAFKKWVDKFHYEYFYGTNDD